MFQIVYSILTILKYSSILILLKLISTAFNIKFGVNRQYIKLLELLFQIGEEKIQKVESEHNMFLNGYCSKSINDELSSLKNHSYNDFNKINNEKNFIKRPNELKFETSQELENNQQKQQQKLRRISTPDGPPVFLLDQDSDSNYDSDSNSDFNNNDENFNDNNNNRSLDINENKFIKKHKFHLDDACKLIIRGISAIIDDDVTKRFYREQLKTWNLLTRTNFKNYHIMSNSLGLFWFFGLLFRYSILFPLRILFFIAAAVWLVISLFIIRLLPKKWGYRPFVLANKMSNRMISCGLSSRVEFHNPQYRAKKSSIVVSNHTTPFDVIFLGCDNCYSAVAQRHNGLIGIYEYLCPHNVFFDRNEVRDRQFVTEKLKEHVNNKNSLPILIFPEGTCINNSAVMMFRKGSFEITDKIYPIAVKYDPRFGDPFWNSSKQSYLKHILLMMSSWAIKCDVWYLPPMIRKTNETSAEFANRVKSEIARQAGLADLNWDGQLKRTVAKEIWKHQQQEDFVKRLKLE